MTDQYKDSDSALFNNILLVIIVVIFIIFVMYQPEYDCGVETDFEGIRGFHNGDALTIEKYSDSKSFSRTGTGPIGYSIPSSNLDKSLQGDYHLKQYVMDEAWGTEYANVKLLTDRIADKIAEFTLRAVVEPCMNSENLKDIDDRLACIREYPHYYTDILKYSILEMFSQMDEFEIDPFKRGVLKRENQRYQAMIGLVQAYTKSLDSSLRVMMTRYKDIGFIPDDFRANLSYVLSQWFLFRLTQIFRNPDMEWSSLGAGTFGDNISIVSDHDPDTAPESGLPMDTIDLTPMNPGSWSVSCPDLNSGNINIAVSGRRLRCGAMKND